MRDRLPALAVAVAALGVLGGAAEEHRARVRALLVADRLPTHLADLRDEALGMAGSQGCTGPRADARVRAAFDPDAALERVVAAVAARLDPAAREDLEAFDASDLGRKARASEQAASEAGAGAFDDYAAGLTEDPPTPERLALAERTVAASGTARLWTRERLALKDALRAGCGALEGHVDRGGFLEAIRRAEEGSTRRRMEGAAVAATLFAHRDLTREELAAFADFRQSPPARAYADAVGSAVLEALEEAGRRLWETRDQPL